MSADPSASRAHPMDSERRRSWWKRVTNKMKRRSSAVLTERSSTPAAEREADMATRAVTPTTTNLQPIISLPSDNAIPESAPIASSSAVGPPAMVADTEIAVDTEDEVEESMLPMLSSRTGITEGRARDLFAKYGMDYGSRGKQPTSEPPSKIRRVEKPVRLRVHWTCHECSRQFGMEKTCHSCGHRRCRDCTRHPPKRVQEVMENTRREIEDQDATIGAEFTTETASAIDPDLARYQQEPSAPVVTAEASHTASIHHEEEAAHPKGAPRTQAAPVTGNLQAAAPLELDLDQNDEEVDLPNIHFSMYARPRAGVTSVFKSKAQLVRRACHKCDTQFLPPTRTDCQNCGHDRCDACPRYPSKKAAETPPPPPLTVKAVQRVYRKPRQRVRYTCEHCNTLFVDSDRCFECGHERCCNCTREPPKRSPPRYDPAVIQAVADRLAGFGPHSPGISASAG